MRTRAFVVALVVGCLSHDPVGATVFHVNNQSANPTPPYNSDSTGAHRIQDAIDRAAFAGEPGDTIDIWGDPETPYEFCSGDSGNGDSSAYFIEYPDDPYARKLRRPKFGCETGSGVPQPAQCQTGDTTLCQVKPLFIDYPLYIRAHPGTQPVLKGTGPAITVEDSTTYLAFDGGDSTTSGHRKHFDKFPMIITYIPDGVRATLGVGEDWVTIEGLEICNAGTIRGVRTGVWEAVGDTLDNTLSTTMGGAVQCWLTNTRLKGNYIHDIFGATTTAAAALCLRSGTRS